MHIPVKAHSVAFFLAKTRQYEIPVGIWVANNPQYLNSFISMKYNDTNEYKRSKEQVTNNDPLLFKQRPGIKYNPCNFCCDFLFLVDVNEWITHWMFTCRSVYIYPSIHDSAYTHSHASEEENRTRIRRKNCKTSVKAHFHSRKISTDRKFSENIIVKSWKFPTSKFFSRRKIFPSANHILQYFLSAENFPECKWALRLVFTGVLTYKECAAGRL
jgi:hypothetical protein